MASFMLPHPAAAVSVVAGLLEVVGRGAPDDPRGVRSVRRKKIRVDRGCKDKLAVLQTVRRGR